MDAYLKKGDWHRASIEFQRVAGGFPEYRVELGEKSVEVM
jgi:hypothetical protein